jgi:DnaA family protein
MFNQLSLAVSLDDQATFENFYAPNGSAQHMAMFLLQDESRMFAYFCGPKGSGLSHLLQAACQADIGGNSRGRIYLPLKQLKTYPPDEVFNSLENSALVCIDDVDHVTSSMEWQVALFNLFNKCNERGCRLIIASHLSVDELEIELQDLHSRFKSGVCFVLPLFNGDDQRRLMQYRSNMRGLYLPNEVAIFLLNRLPRDTHKLMKALDVLDKISLKEQRRLTIPFVKVALDL